MTNGADEVIFLVDLISVLHIFLLLNYMQTPVVWHFRSIVNKHLLRVLLNSLEIMVYESGMLLNVTCFDFHNWLMISILFLLMLMLKMGQSA